VIFRKNEPFKERSAINHERYETIPSAFCFGLPKYGKKSQLKIWITFMFISLVKSLFEGRGENLNRWKGSCPI